MSKDYKICPECLEEFTLTSIECSSCGVPLESADDVDLDDDDDEEGFPPISELECVRVGPLPWTRALSEKLTEVGIGHRIEHDTRDEDEGGVDPARFGGQSVYGTWVMPADLDAAEEIDLAIFGDVDSEDEEYDEDGEVCPACQEDLPADASECPSCGLSFG